MLPDSYQGRYASRFARLVLCLLVDGDGDGVADVLAELWSMASLQWLV